MKKSIKRITGILLPMIVCLSILSFNASAYSLSVPAVQKAKQAWCWAACADMIGKYETSSIMNQWDAVQHIKGTPCDLYPDVGGTLYDAAVACQYLCEYIPGYYGLYIYTPYYNVLSYNEIVTKINNSDPMVAYLLHSNNSAHDVVIYGYDNGSIKYINPDNGNYYTITYSDFVNVGISGYKYTYTVYKN